MNRTKNCFILKDLLFSGKKNIRPWRFLKVLGAQSSLLTWKGDEPMSLKIFTFSDVFVGFVVSLQV